MRFGASRDADLREDIRSAADGYAGVHGGFGFGAVARAKDKAYEDLYKKLDSKEGANDIYKIAKARERKRRDLGNVRYIKDEGGRTIDQPTGRNKVVCPDQIPIEAWKCLKDEGVKWLTCLFNKIFSSAKMHDEWRLRRETRVTENQFGFMPGRSTTEAIHLFRSLMEKYRERQRDLHMAFLDLEKAYDCILRELVWRTLIDKGAPRRY
ncbi:retrovirus-related pol polyprotein LINE-1 [Tanacetum coccineum]